MVQMRALAVLTICLFHWIIALCGDVKFCITVGAGKHRDILRSLIAEFELKNPTIKIKLTEMSNTEYHIFMTKEGFKQHDVVWWFAGYQLQEYAAKGYIEPLDDVWKSERLIDCFNTTVNSISYAGSKYAIPISFYQWGFYYRQDIFDRYNLQAPRTWREFETVCDTLKSKGISPIVIGIRDNWTASAWFSYLDLRMNGLSFHLDLLRGKESYMDNRVKRIFETWKQLLDKGYFNASMNDIDWKGINAFMYNEQAAMTLIGNFMVVDIKPQFIDKIKYFQFPIIDKTVPIFEEAPVDVLFLTRGSENKNDAKRFLAFWSKSDTLDKYNSAVGQLSTHNNSKPDNNYFTQSGSKVLKEAKGFSQFWDRDTSNAMAEKGFVTLANFMRNRDIAKTMTELEEYRKMYFH